MGALQAGDGADWLAGSRVHHFDSGVMSDVKPVGRIVAEQVIPAALASDFPVIGDVIILRSG